MKAIVLFLCLLPICVFSQSNSYTAEDIVNRIKKQVTCKWADKTVDTFKAGNPSDEVSGIVSCMFADMNVLQKAVELNCNFIITHEPIFYNHLDETSNYTSDPVYTEKLKFIEKHNLIVFRFHDHIHKTKPDGIYEGMINKLGWKKYSVDGSLTDFKFPKTTIAELSENIKKTLSMETVRVIGDPAMHFTNVTFSAGAPGGPTHIRTLQNKKVEVLVAGEAPEWETYLYANDAVQQNKNKAVIFLGHIKSEEAGMKYCADWLQEFVKDIPIHFVENKLNFHTL